MSTQTRIMNARIQRLNREATGSIDLQQPFPQSTLRAIVLVTLVIVIIALATPPEDGSRVLAGSPIDAYAAAVVAASRMPPPAANATDGQVQDLTY